MSFVPRTSLESEYQAGATLRELAVRHGVSYGTVRKYIKCLRPQGNRCHHTIDESAFDELTPASAYWAGFLLADGCVLSPKRGQQMVSVKLQQGDKEHLEKFKRFLKADYQIHTNAKEGAVEFKFPSNKIVRVLSTYGIVPRKSCQETAPDALLDDHNFWRGVIDGDGWLGVKRQGKYEYCNISLCGSVVLCTQFTDYVERLVGRHYKVRRLRKNTNCHLMTISRAGDAMHVADALYGGAEIALARKLETAMNWVGV